VKGSEVFVIGVARAGTCACTRSSGAATSSSFRGSDSNSSTGAESLSLGSGTRFALGTVSCAGTGSSYSVATRSESRS